MRVFSFAQESTRYCNYSKDKFGNELTFIIPSWLNIPEDRYSLGKLRSKDNSEETCMVEVSENNGAYNIESPIGKFLHVLDYSSDRYLELISEGWTPQQARQILPNALKTEVVMTGFIRDWDLFFGQRARGKFTDSMGREHISIPHPDMLALTKPLLQEFIKRGYLNEESN